MSYKIVDKKTCKIFEKNFAGLKKSTTFALGKMKQLVP